jgi:hypothetical protein
MKISAQTMSSNSKVVIIGGGFRELCADRTTANHPVDVTFNDRTNHHLFRPLLAERILARLVIFAIGRMPWLNRKLSRSD